MDNPPSLRIIGPQGHPAFRASIGTLDIHDNPSYCRGTTHTGLRCSRKIADSHIPKLPAFNLKGLVAYYKPKNSATNRLAAYYCWQHTSQATFTRRASTIVTEEEGWVRRPLAEKTGNGVVRGVVTGKIKVEETENAQASCRARARPVRVEIAMPGMRDVETLSPAVVSPVRKMFVFKDGDTENGKAVSREEKTEVSTTSAAARRKTAEMAELKAVNATLQAALQQLTGTEESRSAEVKELKSANATLLAAVQALTGQVEGLKVQVLKIEEEKMVPVDLRASAATGSKEVGAGAQAGYQGQRERMKMEADVAKEPLISVKPADLEMGMQDNEGTRVGLWQRVKRAFCLGI